MLGAEERHELDARRFVQQVDGQMPVAIAAGMIRDQPDLAALHPGELFANEDIDAGQGLFRRLSRRLDRRRNGVGNFVPDRLCHDRRHIASEFVNAASRLGVNSIAEENDGSFARGVEPDRRAGEAGMAKPLVARKSAFVGRVTGLNVPAERAQSARDFARSSELFDD